MGRGEGQAASRDGHSPTRIVWSLITYGYAADLQIPWSIATRTMWAERPGDRVFEESLFWIQTRAILHLEPNFVVNP